MKKLTKNQIDQLNNQNEYSKEKLYNEIKSIDTFSERKRVYKSLTDKRRRVIANYQVDERNRKRLMLIEELINSLLNPLNAGLDSSERVFRELLDLEDVKKLSIIELALLSHILHYDYAKGHSLVETQAEQMNRKTFESAVNTVIKYLKKFDEVRGIGYAESEQGKLYTGSYKEVYELLEHIDYISFDSIATQYDLMKLKWELLFKQLGISKNKTETVLPALKKINIRQDIYTNSSRDKIIEPKSKSKKVVDVKAELIVLMSAKMQSQLKSPKWFRELTSFVYARLQYDIDNKIKRTRNEYEKIFSSKIHPTYRIRLKKREYKTSK